MKKIAYFLIALFFIVFVLCLAYYFFVVKRGVDFLPEKENNIVMQKDSITHKKMVDFSKTNQDFSFLAEIPEDFELEYIPQLRAINIYNPHLNRESMREKSQIYISFFKASKFLTLSTVEITRQDKITIKDHEAVVYEITKKNGVPNFPGQPNWRNFQHIAIDVRLNKDNPSYFYSFAQDPNFSQTVFEEFINSIVFTDK